MFKVFFIITLCIPLVVLADTANERVEKADQYRQSSDQLKINTVIKLYKNNQLDRERSYDVYTKPGRRSLVVSTSPSEKGQRVLMIEDNFWLLLPKTKRPIRITPVQKLLGEASTGDVATMSWHDDYSAVFSTGQQVNESGHIELTLSARRKGVTYHRIELTLMADTNRPVEAKLYLSSGKQAKTARFEMANIDGQQQVQKMILIDKIQKNRYTEIVYLARKNHSLSDKYYNPSYLAKNPSLVIR